jgi:hypothetical protein
MVRFGTVGLGNMDKILGIFTSTSVDSATSSASADSTDSADSAASAAPPLQSLRCFRHFHRFLHFRRFLPQTFFVSRNPLIFFPGDRYTETLQMLLRNIGNFWLKWEARSLFILGNATGEIFLPLRKTRVRMSSKTTRLRKTRNGLFPKISKLSSFYLPLHLVYY